MQKQVKKQAKKQAKNSLCRMCKEDCKDMFKYGAAHVKPGCYCFRKGERGNG